MTSPRWMPRGLLCGLAGMLLPALLAAAAHADGAAVWSMQGEHNTIYLAGSVHALPREHAGFSPQLERAYRAADVIVMEVDLDDLDPLVAMDYIAAHGTLPPAQTLADVIGAKRYAAVTRLADTLGLPEAAIERLEPWAAAMVLTQLALVKSGFDPQLGIDMQISARAGADGKRIDGLESVVDQLGVFDSRPLREQARFLADAVDDVPKMHDDLQRLIDAWRAGDLRALEREFRKERAHAPKLYDDLLGARNRKWLPQIEALLREDRDYRVVVGTLHFVGRDGLLELLKRAGHRPVALPAAAAAPAD